MEKLKLTEIAKIFNQEVTTELVIESISTDSRQNSPNSLFIALTGENFDGHNYIHKAYQNGAVACISQKPIKDLPNVIVVEDTREAMLKIAKYYKSLFNTFTVGVTGSVGKTSTKEMIYTILQGSGKTLKTFGNLNNEIGLPKMVFMLDRTYKNAVFEMGMSDLNQIAPLSKTVSPNVGVITNIGICHIETLKTQENILKAKLEITQGMVADAPLVLNGDDALLRSLELDRPVMYYGIENQNAEIVGSNIVSDGTNTTFDISFYGKTISATLPTVGTHNVMNALAGFCIGTLCEIPPEEIVAAMKWYKNADMRQNAVNYKGVTIIQDCYNASPNSMKSAIDVITSINCEGKRVCVLGDMLELGDYSDDAHIEVGKLVGRSKVDTLICYGQQGKLIKKGAIMVAMKNVYHFEDKTALSNFLKSNLVSGDAVIFKASRGMKLEEVLNLYTDEEI